MASFTIKNLTFAYPKGTKNALEDVSLSVAGGEVLLICGTSGCGKSTLLRHLKTVLTPHGRREGEILFDGVPLQNCDVQEQARRIGYVLQHPDDQIVTDKVWHELSFGLENLGVNQQTMRLRVGEMASYFGIQSWFYKDVCQLSGGQKQLLNLASIMAMNPDVLILDEPTSQLDPIAAADFLATLKKLNQELGITMVLTEHRLEEALPMADRVAVLDQGRCIAFGTPAEVALQLKREDHCVFEAMPTPMRIYGGLDTDCPCPLTVRDGRNMLQNLGVQPARVAPEPVPPLPKSAPVLELKECWFRYEKNGSDILRDLSMALYPGEIFGVVGGNGTGKSTMLSVISGQNKIYRGKILRDNRPLKPGFEAVQQGIGALCQDPRSLFVKDCVREDLLDALQNLPLPQEEMQHRLQDVIAQMELEDYLDSHPYDLSGGEQQRVAIAKVLLSAPKILLLDEPTKGMDAAFKNRFGAMLRRMASQGISILLVCHDIEFCAAFADRCGLFFDGSIISQNTPRAFFAGNHFYTTTANRMARELFPDAILPQEVITLCKQQCR